MVIYTKDDAELRIPNAIGNINLTITEGGGDVNLEDYYTKNQADNKFATKVGLNTIADNVNELSERVTNLEENGTPSGDVVYFNFNIEEGEYNKNDDFSFKKVAQALKENKVVYVNGKLVTSYDVSDDFVTGDIVISNLNEVVEYKSRVYSYEHNTVFVSSDSYFALIEEHINYIDGEINNLNKRVTNLENTTPSEPSEPISNVYTIAKSQLSQEKIPEIVTAFENGEVIIYGNNRPSTKLYGKVIALGGQGLTVASKSLKLLVAWYYSVLPTNRNVIFKEIFINADGVEEFDVNITDLKNRLETLENNGGTSSGEKEVVTIEVMDDLSNITPQQLMEICNNIDKQYIIKLIADNIETFNVINTFKSANVYRINILRYLDTVAEIFYTDGDETVGYNEVYLKIYDENEGSESTVVFEIDGGIENIDGGIIDNINFEY